VSKDVLLKNSRFSYQLQIKAHGLSSDQTIQAGLMYVSWLRHLHHHREAEQLFAKLVSDSRHAHGPEHSCTTALADAQLKECKERYIIVLP